MKTLFEGIIYAGSNYLSMVFTVISGLIIRLWVPPEAFGAISFVKGIQMYMDTLKSFFCNTVEREVPVRQGLNDLNGVQSILTTCYTLAFIWTVIESIVFISFILISDEPYLRIAAAIFGITCFMTTYFSLDCMTLKSIQRFKILSKTLLYGSLVSGAISLILCWIFREKGYFGAVILIAAINFLLARSGMGRGWFPYLSTNIRKSEVFYTISIGGQFMLFKFFRQVMDSADRYVVVGFLGLKALGLYSVGNIIMAQVALFPQTLVASYMPKMIANLATGRHDAAHAAAEKLHPSSVIVGTLTACLMVPLADYLIRGFLPEYIPAITAVQILLSAGCFHTSNATSLQLHVGLKRFPRLIALAFVGCLATVAGCYTLYPFGLPGVASGTAIGMAVYSTLMNASARELLDARFFLLWQFTGFVATGLFLFVLQSSTLVMAGLLWVAYAAFGLSYLSRILKIDWARIVPSFRRYLASSES